MSDLLHTPIVLVLNRNWQPIDVKTPVDAFGIMATGNATALNIDEEALLEPTSWHDWQKLEPRPHDRVIGTVHGPMRIPTVIVLARYGKIPKRRPKLNMQSIWERDHGICQYTGRRLQRAEANIDHVLPKSRGGLTTWENCVLSDKRVNSQKADRMPEETGLRLIRAPQAPKSRPASDFIYNRYQVKDWDLFIKDSQSA